VVVVVVVVWPNAVPAAETESTAPIDKVKSFLDIEIYNLLDLTDSQAQLPTRRQHGARCVPVDGKLFIRSRLADRAGGRGAEP
jgi:hypothetical protein